MQDPQIKTRPDGSIDTDFYIQRGRVHRSEAAHQIAKNICDTARVDLPVSPGFLQQFFRRPGSAT